MTPREKAKSQVWHVEPAGSRWLVARGDVAVGMYFGSHHAALEWAAKRNRDEGLTVDPVTVQHLIDMSDSLVGVRRRAARFAERYRDHPAFEPWNVEEDIFTKLARLIEY